MMEKQEVCLLLDKLTLEMLRLMEDRVKCQINVQNATNNASIHLAKTRYIMGQSTISTVQLPTENTADFSALSTVETKPAEDSLHDSVILHNRPCDPEAGYVNPIRWFGILVPQNLYQAQNLFTNALNYIVESVNIQKQLDATYTAILKLKQLKLKLVPEE